MALYFHKISLISILSNVILVPAAGVIMGLGFRRCCSHGR